MTATDALSSISYFLVSVLPNAYSSNEWHEEALHHAFQWAEYCQKVCSVAISKGKALELNKYISNITAPINETEAISVECLSQAVKLLIKAFLQNEELSPDIAKRVLIEGEKAGLDTEQLHTEVEQLKSIHKDVLNAFKPPILNKSSSLLREIDAEFMVEHIKRHISQYSTEQEIESWILEFISLQYKNFNTMQTVLHMLVINEHNALDNLQVLQNLFLQYLIQKSSADGQQYDKTVAAILWSQPCELLTKVSSKYFAFYKHYINVLTNCTKKIEPDYTINFATWAIKDSVMELTYTAKQVATHFKTLCSADTKVADATRSLLIHYTKDLGASIVWKMMLTCIDL